MADKKQVERLKRSVPEWNQWRQEHSEIQPDLSNADLNNADLSGADLNGAKLSGTNLSGTNLNDAHLIRVHLSFADLSHVRLRNTNLSFANLSRINLSFADLSFANLRSADLSGTNLYCANLSDVYLAYTAFAENDLSTVKGLAEIKHGGPSHIELYTVKLPQDGSALHFLQGAGVPDEWIDFYRSTMMHPIQYYSCFISYSSADETLARRLHADLQDQGVRCWFAPHDLRPGQLIRQGIDEAIHMQDKLLIILSKHSVESGWVRYEVETALSREIQQKREILFPIRIDDAVFQCVANWASSLRDQRHIGDFRQWVTPSHYQKVFQRLLHDLKAQNVKPQ